MFPIDPYKGQYSTCPVPVDATVLSLPMKMGTNIAPFASGIESEIIS
jgi:hypothetical protein